MSAKEKSDLPEVAEKRANKAASAAAELVERRGQGECGTAKHGPDAEPGSRVTFPGWILRRPVSPSFAPTLSAKSYCWRTGGRFEELE